MLGLTILLWQMTNATCVLYTIHCHLHLTCDVANGSLTSWRVPKDHGYFWICQEMGVTPCLSDPLIIRHNNTCLISLNFLHMFYHTQEEFLAQRYKREPLIALTIIILMGLQVARTSLGISSLVLLKQEIEIIHSQLT